jgi:hypothetical protein
VVVRGDLARVVRASEVFVVLVGQKGRRRMRARARSSRGSR